MATPRRHSELPPPQRLWFLTVAHTNFWQAARAANVAINFRGPDHIEERIIATEAAIVRFARPFCRCIVPQVRPHGAPKPPQLSAKLSADFIPTGLPGGLSVLRAVMKKRDSLIAHSEIEFKPIRLSRRDPTHASRWKLETLVQNVSDYNLEQLSRVARALAEKAETEVDLLADELFPMVRIGQTALLQFQREGEPPIVR